MLMDGGESSLLLAATREFLFVSACFDRAHRRLLLHSSFYVFPNGKEGLLNLLEQVC